MTETTQLLSVEEQGVCQNIVAQDADVAGRRAAALLAINGGSTHAQASEQTELTTGQISYLLTTFRKKRLAIFPDDVLSRAQSGEQATIKAESLAKNEVLADDEASSENEVEQVSAEAKKEKKIKKAKKNKKDKGKKSKKGKGKDKKKKKGKKSKKGKGKKSGKKKSKK